MARMLRSPSWMLKLISSIWRNSCVLCGTRNGMRLVPSRRWLRKLCGGGFHLTSFPLLSPPGTLPTYHPRPTYPRPNRTVSDNPATRDMHTEANDKRKDFLEARATLKTELVKIIGDGIAETMAADQDDGTIASMNCVQCMEWLERQYGTLNSAHVKTLIAALQTRCERPADFKMHCA